MNIDVEKFNRDGGLLLDTPLKHKMMDLRKSFIEVFDLISQSYGQGPVRSDDDISRLYKGEHRNLWVAAYDQLSNLPEVMALCNEPCFLEALKKLGFKKPAMPIRSVIRADMPFDIKWDITAHQDYVYHYGSNNAVTLWLPFQDTPVDLGALEVIWGTHLEGAKPQVKGILKNAENLKWTQVESKVGQVLLFNQFLFHQSGKNTTNKIRFSIQIRYNDLGAEDYQKRYFYLNWDDQKKNDKDPDYKTFFPAAKAESVKV